MMNDKLKEISNKVDEVIRKNALSHSKDWASGVNIPNLIRDIAQLQLANKEWQNDYDVLKTKYDLLVEDKLDAKQAGRDEVINKLMKDTENRTDDYIAKIVKVIIAEYHQTQLKEQT